MTYEQQKAQERQRFLEVATGRTEVKTTKITSRKISASVWLPTPGVRQQPGLRIQRTQQNVTLSFENLLEELKQYLKNDGKNGWRPISEANIVLKISIHGELAPCGELSIYVEGYPAIRNVRGKETLALYPTKQMRDTRYQEGQEVNISVNTFSNLTPAQLLEMSEGSVIGEVYPFQMVDGVLTDGQYSVPKWETYLPLKYGKALKQLVIDYGWDRYTKFFIGRFAEEQLPSKEEASEGTVRFSNPLRMKLHNREFPLQMEQELIREALENGVSRDGAKGKEYAYVRVGDLVTNGVRAFQWERPKRGEWATLPFRPMKELAWHYLLTSIQGLFDEDARRNWYQFGDKSYREAKKREATEKQVVTREKIVRERKKRIVNALGFWSGGGISSETVLGDHLLFVVFRYGKSPVFVVDNIKFDSEEVDGTDTEQPQGQEWGAAYLFTSRAEADRLISGKLTRKMAMTEGIPRIIHAGEWEVKLVQKIDLIPNMPVVETAL